jgi:Growth-Arrest-Specific Protein 2 Domain
MDDMLADLSPATTLEAFTPVSGTLKASIEAASETQRAFGIRAAVASKKIQEWKTELSTWPWPNKTSEGFEIPTAKRRKISNGNLDNHQTEEVQGFREDDRFSDKEEYWGSLPAADVRRYESRIEEISEDMEDLNVEEIKSQVLDRHVLPRSRASSLSGHYIEPFSSQSYTRMDDFTAVVTATVLQALPSLSRLMALMDVWSVRLSVLRQVSPLMTSMEDAQVALRSGWNAIRAPESEPGSESSSPKASVLSRQDYEIMRDVLQEKVSKLGQKFDHMLDTLEGRNDTLPEAWLDRMESLEQDYGEWVVCGERKVSEDEWAEVSAARRLERLRLSTSVLANPRQPNSEAEDLVLKPEDKLDATLTASIASQAARTVHTEDIKFVEAPETKPTCFDLPITEPLPQYSGLSLSSGPEDDILPRQASNDVISSEKNISQPTDSAKSTQSNQQDVKVETPSLKPESPLPASHAGIDPPAHQGEIVTDLSSLPDGVLEEGESKEEPPKPANLPQPTADYPKDVATVDKNEFEAGHAKIMEPMTPAAARQILMADDLPGANGSPSSPLESSPSSHNMPNLASSPADPSTNGHYHELSRTSSGSSKIPRFEHPPANSFKKEMSPEAPTSPSPRSGTDSSRSFKKSNATTTANFSEASAIKVPLTPKQDVEDFRPDQLTSDEASLPPLTDITIPELPKSVPPSTLSSKPTRIDLPSSPTITTSERETTNHLSPDISSANSTKGHTREPSSASIISGYATSEPSPVIHEAEPTEYFRPVSPPIIAKLPDLSTVTTPTRASFNSTPVSAKAPQTGLTWEPEVLHSQGSSQSQQISLDSPKQENPTKQKAESESSGTPARRRPVSNDSVVSVIRTALGQGRTSQEGSVSEVSTINERLNSVTSTPVRIESPAMETVPRSWHSQFVSDYDGDSPSLGRVRLPNDINNYSPASSPPPETPPSEHRPLQLRKTPSFDPDSFYPDSPATPGEPPALSNVELSPTPALSSPPKHSDDQLQQQISEILESIPARIRLTSEPDMTGTSGIKPTKKRISLNPFSRPASRAATPSFTLAPAYSRNPRPRPQNGNPEIKLYHLSRSTGEAPIKLFVRLVGEHGERVMVRVGGGWADLGEYLKEYASHHGRRSDQPSKVEIQDLPPRVVSTGSTTSTSTLRNGTWNTSEASSPASRPGSRPGSALGRPLSSLAIRKTRKSVGEEAREKAYRSPSTPLSPAFRSSPSVPRQNETPPSANSARSVSQMSWREDESSLGLAGPRSRKGEISAENAAWVESMKEKVRIASAEKEKKEKATFGDMGQVGATKRLFKRSG